MRAVVMMSILSAALLTFAGQTQEYYRWQDEQGQLHVSQMPPPANVDYEVVYPGSAEPTQMKAKLPRQDKAAAPVTAAELNALKQQVGQVNARLKQQNCSLARQNKQRLASDSAVTLDDPGKNAQPLSEEMRTEQLALAERQIQEFCQQEPANPTN